MAEHRVKLYQSRAYMMKNAQDQASFYRLLAKLLWYLGSGNSHVGYLCNCPKNPFVAKLVLFYGYLGLMCSRESSMIALLLKDWRDR